MIKMINKIKMIKMIKINKIIKMLVINQNPPGSTKINQGQPR